MGRVVARTQIGGRSQVPRRLGLLVGRLLAGARSTRAGFRRRGTARRTAGSGGKSGSRSR
eukprot:10359911-Lingulodinium_polyedra.AAC.1